MTSRRLWIMLALLLCAVTAVAVALPSTLAYVTANSNTMHNTFRVEFLPPKDVSVPVRVHKTVLYTCEEPISPAGFSFRLMNLTTGEVTSMTTFTDGWATLNLTFTAEDVGRTYQYRLYEVDGGREHMVYDETVYDFSISLVLNETHEMTAVVTMDGEIATEILAEFVNVYDFYEVPDTGDHEQPLLWLAVLLIGSVGVALLSRKKAA